MATAGKDTGGSQFFICHSEQPHLDRRYTLFGRVISGIEIVDIIEIDDEILKIFIKTRGAL
jgi:cyclophilin family peptidyl-prolyl cis-trans isomerase